MSVRAYTIAVLAITGVAADRASLHSNAVDVALC
jgi:hypothetical protein